MLVDGFFRSIPRSYPRVTFRSTVFYAFALTCKLFMKAVMHFQNKHKKTLCMHVLCCSLSLNFIFPNSESFAASATWESPQVWNQLSGRLTHKKHSVHPPDMSYLTWCQLAGKYCWTLVPSSFTKKVSPENSWLFFCLVCVFWYLYLCFFDSFLPVWCWTLPVWEYEGMLTRFYLKTCSFISVLICTS